MIASGVLATARDPLRANQAATAGGVNVRNPETNPTRRAQRSSILPPSRANSNLSPGSGRSWGHEVSFPMLAFDLGGTGLFASNGPGRTQSRLSISALLRCTADDHSPSPLRTAMSDNPEGQMRARFLLKRAADAVPPEKHQQECQRNGHEPRAVH